MRTERISKIAHPQVQVRVRVPEPFRPSRTGSRIYNYVSPRDLLPGAEPTNGFYNNLVLRAMSPALIHDIGSYLTDVVLTKHQFLMPRGESSDFVYFPLTAIVSDYSMLQDGRTVEIAVTGRDGAVGLSSILLNSNSTADLIRVSQAGSAKRIDARTLAEAIRSNEGCRMDLNGFVGNYIEQISQRAICNMYHSVEERLCTWLLMAQDRCGLSTINVTHDDLAQILGVFRPTVTSIALNLRRDKIIDYARGTISIRDRQLVETSACACYLKPAWISS